MKAKLIKRGENNYKLYVNEATFATTDNSPYKRLSLKNCQAIENGYDLDELALEVFELDLNCQGDCNNYYERFAFKLGFQKALEILGDKKFTEDAIYDSVMLGAAFEAPGIKGVETYNELKDLAIKRNSKTVWDVEISYQKDCCSENSNCGNQDSCNICTPTYPKLDANNCLILKRVEL